jgi:hypothetical protein
MYYECMYSIALAAIKHYDYNIDYLEQDYWVEIGIGYYNCMHFGDNAWGRIYRNPD